MKYLLSFLLLLLLSYPCLKSGIAFAQAQSAAQAPAPTPQPAKAVPAPASSAAQPKNKNPFLRAIDYLFGGPSPSTLNRAPTPENFFGGPGPSRALKPQTRQRHSTWFCRRSQGPQIPFLRQMDREVCHLLACV
jgi:hypothetical protein